MNAPEKQTVFSAILVVALLALLVSMMVIYEQRLLILEEQMAALSTKCDSISSSKDVPHGSRQQQRVITGQHFHQFLQETDTPVRAGMGSDDGGVVRRSVSDVSQPNVSSFDAWYTDGLRKALTQAVDYFVSTSMRQLCVNRRRICLPGPKGDKGEEGYQGRPGTIGEPGIPGRDGIAGPPGKVGPKGQRGSHGRSGEKGVKGEMGKTGQRGSSGPLGLAGLPGSKGEPGIKGDKGHKGDGGFMLPRACSSKTVRTLTDVRRKISNQHQGAAYRCDSGKNNDFYPGEWHRFADNVGLRMPETCSPAGTCGTAVTGWLKGGHPSLIGQEVSRVVCFSYDSCCQWQVMIQVINCGSFYLYKLPSTPNCYLGYCSDA
jgi:hypothetical protein